MSLYLDYRPTSLDEVYGNVSVVNTLKGMFAKNKVPQVILLQGPTGCGKTTIGRIIANMLECDMERYYNEIDSGQFRGIDTVRDIRQKVNYQVANDGTRVFLIDEVHKLTGDAQNAFLKTLEDTPRKTYFILSTSEPQKLIKALVGRCSVFQVSKLNADEMGTLLKTTAAQEGKKITDEIANLIINEADGHARNGLQILEQVLSVPKSERLQVAQKASVLQSEGIDLCRALIKHEPWGKIKVLLAGMKDKEPESIRRIVVGYAASVLLGKEDDLAALILEAFGQPFYDTGFPQLVMACYIVTKG